MRAPLSAGRTNPALGHRSESTGRRDRFRPLALLLGVASLSACFDQALGPTFESEGHLSISNDEAALAARVSYPNEIVPIETGAAPAGLLAGPALAPRAITLTLIAEVEAPTIGGQVVQATAVAATRSDRAVVSYNFRGPTARGSLDYFTDLDTRRPRLRSSLEYADGDVNAVWFDDDWAYAAVSSSDVSLAFPAVLERIELRGNRFRTDDATRLGLTSFAATSVMTTGRRVYVTTGDGGHVFGFDDDDLDELGRYALDDARWVAYDEEGDRLVVAQGTPGRISVFDEGAFPGGSMQLINTFPFPGADVAESKSTVEIDGEKAFIAAGADGVQIVCLDNGQIVGSVPRPNPASLGLDPAVVVTNAVTVDDDVMFISNGEAGVYAAVAAEDFDRSDCDEPQQITVLGRLGFGSLESVNHVVYRNGLLFVAAGLGGLKIVDVDTR